MTNHKIAIVDDHALYRLGVQSVIGDNLPDISIVGEYASGKDFLRSLESGFFPDVVMLDIIMPEMSGVEVARILHSQYPEIKIIMLSSEANYELVGELLTIGVNGYLSKMAVQQDLVAAITSVLAGNHFYGKDIAQIMYDIYIAKVNSKSAKNKFFTKNKEEITLTEREKEVIKLLCGGISVKEVAEILCVSPRTIDNHKANIMQKLGFHSTVELVKYAVKEGIVML